MYYRWIRLKMFLITMVLIVTLAPFWAADPKGTMSYRIEGEFPSVQTNVRRVPRGSSPPAPPPAPQPVIPPLFYRTSFCLNFRCAHFRFPKYVEQGRGYRWPLLALRRLFLHKEGRIFWRSGCMVHGKEAFKPLELWARRKFLKWCLHIGVWKPEWVRQDNCWMSIPLRDESNNKLYCQYCQFFLC